MRCSYQLATAWLCRAPEKVGTAAAAADDDDDNDDADEELAGERVAPHTHGSAKHAKHGASEKQPRLFWRRTKFSIQYGNPKSSVGNDQ